MSNIFVPFLHGLALFSLSVAVFMETRHASKLPLSRHLPWLVGFGFTDSLYIWIKLFLDMHTDGAIHTLLEVVIGLLLPISALLLVRFGIGLIQEAGPLPDWITFVPVVLFLPLGLVLGYALIISSTEPPYNLAVEVWSRYLLLLPANLLAAFGFFRQWRRLPGAGIYENRGPLLGVSWLFVLNAISSGLFVPEAPYSLAAVINETVFQSVTGADIAVFRTITASGVTLFAIWSLGVFESERRQQIARLDADRSRAQRAAIEVQENARREAENWKEALVQISRQIASLEDVDQMLLSIVEMTRRLLNGDVAMLGLWGEDASRLLIKCYATPSSSEVTPPIPVTNETLVEKVRQCEHYQYTTGGENLSNWVCPLLEVEVGAGAMVPLMIDGQSLGGLWLIRVENQPLNWSDIQGLEHLADQAVIVLEQSLMAGKLQSLAVVEERSRIAREMHDGLAQVLGYMGLEIQVLEALVKQGETEKVLSELKQARNNVLTTQDDVRENILSLRTTLSGEAGLISGLEEYIHEFGVQTGIETQFICDCQEAPAISPMAETQLVRITQEALANVRKHSQAHHVQVRLAIRESYLCVTIIDDGAGFNLPATRGHFGLVTMRERAESVEGHLTVTSQVGEGTEVNLWLPLLQHPTKAKFRSQQIVSQTN